MILISTSDPQGLNEELAKATLVKKGNVVFFLFINLFIYLFIHSFFFEVLQG